MDALAFLNKSSAAKRQPIYVLAGDEDFLKRQCREKIRGIVLGDTDPEFALAAYSGDKLDFSTVRNDLETLPFLAPARLVEVDDADPFVTAHRPALERYADAPSKLGVLVLDVKTFPETTRLAKAIPDAGKISCKAPAEHKIADWCVTWTAKRLGKTLESDAAALLLDRVGFHLGLLAAELEKLTVAVGDRSKIGPADVEAFASRSREGDVFKILDAIGAGKTTDAVSVLERLFDEGEDPLAILGPITYQLRKLTAVARHHAEGSSLPAALDAAGIPKWPKARDAASAQVTHLGLRRLNAITEWLVELNYGLKGGNDLPKNLQMERFIVRLARPRDSSAKANVTS
jgi:DNA polymerase-3 subunit delta